MIDGYAYEYPNPTGIRCEKEAGFIKSQIKRVADLLGLCFAM